MKDEMLAWASVAGRDARGHGAAQQGGQSIGRATHLLALNASVEAPASQAGGGFGVVAQEVRALAGQAKLTGIRIGKHVQTMQERMTSIAAEVRRHDTDDDEIGIAGARARARCRWSGSLTEISRSSRGLREASRRVQADLEKIYMSLQSQDRPDTQMLNAVTEDMARVSAPGSRASRMRPPARRLSGWSAWRNCYTMEELRSSHPTPWRSSAVPPSILLNRFAQKGSRQ
jgi:methyl-accepting chemotaxis protein